MADENTDLTASGDTNGNPESNGSTTTKPAPVLAYTKEELTRITQREVGKVLAEKTALESELAKFREQEEAERVAKLSKEAREKEALAKEKAAVDAHIAELTQAVATATTARLNTVRDGKAATLAGSIATSVANAGLMPHVESTIARALVIEVVDGVERISIQLGAPGDTEPLDTGFPKFRDKFLAPFLRVATGSGSQHGGGGSGGGMRATSLEEALVNQQKNRR